MRAADYKSGPDGVKIRPADADGATGRWRGKVWRMGKATGLAEQRESLERMEEMKLEGSDDT
jgi:hypothetical protein